MTGGPAGGTDPGSRGARRGGWGSITSVAAYVADDEGGSRCRRGRRSRLWERRLLHPGRHFLAAPDYFRDAALDCVPVDTWNDASERQAQMVDVLSQLLLEGCAGILMRAGLVVKGVSWGECKDCVASELLTNPSTLLLDGTYLGGRGGVFRACRRGGDARREVRRGGGGGGGGTSRCPLMVVWAMRWGRVGLERGGGGGRTRTFTETRPPASHSPILFLGGLLWRRMSLFCSLFLTFPPPCAPAAEWISGLDSATALSVVRLLCALADEWRTIIATLHVLPFPMLPLFDNIMLLSAGRVAFSGPAGAALPHCTSLGVPCPPRYNPCNCCVQLLTDAATDGSQSVTWRPEVAWAEWEAAGVGASAVLAAAAVAAAVAGAASPPDAVPPKGCRS